MYLKNVMNIYILHVCTFIFSCNYSWHCSCMYQMFICLYWNYNVKIIAFIGKKSEIKKNDQTKKKKEISRDKIYVKLELSIHVPGRANHWKLPSGANTN